MRNKKILVLLLCMVFVFSALSGCGGNTSTNSQTSTAAVAQTTTAKPEPVKLVYEKPLWGTQPLDSEANVAVRNKIKELLNIDLEVVGQPNPTDQTQKANLMIASGEQLDFFPTSTVKGEWLKYKADGTIISLNELMDKSGQDILKNGDKSALKAMTDKDGKIWGTPYETFPCPNGFIFRKDLLDKYNLTAPTTIEEFEKVTLLLNEKEGLQGHIEAWPGMLDRVFAGGWTPFGAENYLDTDGKIKPWYTHPGAKDYLAKMAEWYKKGIITKEFATMQYQQDTDAFYTNQKGSSSMAWLGSLQAMIDQGRKTNPKFDLIVIPPPKGPAGNCIRTGNAATGAIVVTKTCKYPEEVMKYINFSSATDEGFLLTSYGIEGKDWDWADKANGKLKKTSIPDEKRFESLSLESNYTTGILNLFNLKYNWEGNNDKEVLKFMNDVTKYPSRPAPDVDVTYDINKMKSKDKQQALKTLIDEAKYAIIMGRKPLDSWDGTLKKWYEEGGTEYIDDLTAQYREVHP